VSALFAGAPLTFVDLEMTGLDPSEHHICEVAAIRVEAGREVGRLEALVRPPGPVGRSAEVHGLTDERLADAPALETLRRPLAALLEGATLVGHSVHHDLAFLQAAAARGQLEPPPDRWLCTRQLARRVWRRPGYGLGRLAAALDLPPPTHRAMSDVASTRALFARLVEELRPTTVEDLRRSQSHDGPATMRDDHRACLAEAVAARRPVAVRYRVPGRDPFEDVLEVWQLAPPRVEGWLRRGAAQRVLRGDRLIRVAPAEGSYDVPESFRSALPRGAR
jgi:DNA polymerase-3 subunit epsilon